MTVDLKADAAEAAVAACYCSAVTAVVAAAAVAEPSSTKKVERFRCLKNICLARILQVTMPVPLSPMINM